MSSADADVVFNRAALALAKNQQLVSSWLPPLSAAELARREADEAECADEAFVAVPELYVCSLSSRLAGLC